MLPTPEILSCKERGWSEEREEIKDKKKKNHPKGKVNVLSDFPEFQRNIFQGLVQSFPFSLKEKTCRFKTRINSIYFLYFQSWVFGFISENSLDAAQISDLFKSP